MKKLFVLLFLLMSLSTFSKAQNNIRLGINAGSVNPMNLFYDVNGFGMNAEAASTIYKSFDLTASIGWNKVRYSDKFDYMQIPFLIGIRYYPVNFYIKPYVTIEAGASYCNIDQEILTLTRKFGGVPEPPVFQPSRSIRKGVFVGFSPNLGVMFPVAENVDLFVNLKLHFTTESQGSYSLISGGFTFPI